MKNIAIIGGGIAGLTTAIALNQAGIHPLIFEATPKIHPLGAGLGLGLNAISAFEKLGMANEIIEHGRILLNFTIFDQKGKVISKINSEALRKKYGINNFTIHRADLHEILLSKIKPEFLKMGKKAVDFETKEDKINVKFEDETEHITDFLIVADGIHSALRQKLIPKSKPRYAGYTCWRAILEDQFQQYSEASESWGATGRFGIVPLRDRKTYWFACINAQANDPVMKNFRVQDLYQHFKNFHEPIPTLLKNTPEKNLIWNDIIDLQPIDQYAFGPVVFIGDAAHATTPNMGQGACQAIEDGVILSTAMKKNQNWKMAFTEFEKKRLARTHYIVKNSWTLGKIAQIENKWIISLRNSFFRMIPKGFSEKQFKKLLEVDFD